LPGADGLYEDAPCGLLLTASDGTLLRANRTFCRWIGADADALVGTRRFQDLLSMGGRIFHQTHFGPLLHMQGSVSEVKFDLVRAGGDRVPVVVNAVRRRDGDGWHDEIAVFIAKDRHAYERELMLARKRAEELAASQLAVQEELRSADRRKDEFLAMLAHELRNPLAPIATAAHLLRSPAQDPAQDPAQLRRIAEVLQRQTAHLTHLVDDLLDVSRVTRGLVQLERSIVDLADVVGAAIEQSRALVTSRRHTLQVQTPRGSLVDGDHTRLVQVVANLLNNAAKYTPQAGSIGIALEQAGREVGIRVADNGQGIDPALRPHLFDLFSQGVRTPDRSQGGLGIGLALVRSLVDLHGGRVEVESEGLDRGSRFTVWLPAVGQAVASIAPAAAPASSAAAALQVLVVDDNTDAAAMLAEVLHLSGHATVLAANAGEALDAAAGRAFDAYILDIGLPDISGYELARTLRERGQAGMFIALTGYGQAHDRVLSQAAGFDHHMVKPVDIDRLLEILAAVSRAWAKRAPA
jgi:PAS domain S-box-containing protein